VELGHTDTDYTACLNVPSVGLVVAGDAAYNDIHLYLAESNAQTRQEWIAALDKIESLNPRAVVASHKRPENDDNPGIIEQTRQYIRDFDRLALPAALHRDARQLGSSGDRSARLRKRGHPVRERWRGAFHRRRPGDDRRDGGTHDGLS